MRSLAQWKDEQRAKQGLPTRASKQKLYNDRRWRKAAAQYKRDNPLCIECKEAGRISPTYACDHIRPHHGNERLFWLESNWQPLCRECHNRKSQGELNQ